MRSDSEARLTDAIESVKSSWPGDKQLAASAGRLAGRLGLEAHFNRAAGPTAFTIDGCHDVQQRLSGYRAGTLPDADALIVKAHLRDCGACQYYFRGSDQGGLQPPVLDWSRPARVERATRWGVQGFSWAAAPVAALLVCSFFVYRAYWQVPPGVRAEVQSIDGPAYRISGAGDGAGNYRLSPGDTLADGEQVRTGGGAHAVLRLTDGSTIEMNERSVVGVGVRGQNTTVALGNGAVIVQAAKRTSGHLYVKTADCRVAVVGTVFSVDSGLKGSRVAVLQGTVHVEHAGTDTVVQAGDQVATNDNLAAEPLDRQISWSRDREKYLVELAQLSSLQQRLAEIPSPRLRYSSELLQRVPTGTLFYASIPNWGDSLNQANAIFHDQLKQSPVLQEWWNGNGHANTAELDALVEKLHQVSGYLGDEVVVVGLEQKESQGLAVMATVAKPGLGEFLLSSFSPAITVLDEKSLAAAHVSAAATNDAGDAAGRRQYALVRQHEAVFSNSIGTLKQVDAQLNAGASGFATGAFGQQIIAAYSRGAGVILAADMHAMVLNRPGLSRDASGHNSPLEKSGLNDVQYLIAEHREVNGLPANHLNLMFSGSRQHVASWLAAPGPMGSLEFVTPNASMVAAGLSKDPREIAGDIMTLTASENADSSDDGQAQLLTTLRQDLAANLGGEFLLALDGPVLPTPAWKAVIEVRDSAQLEATIERLVQTVHSSEHGQQLPDLAIVSTETEGQRFYTVRNLSGTALAYYTFADGYMIVAPSRALVMAALHAHESGDSFARSAAFKAILPQDENDNYSAIVYQNLGPVMSPLLSQVSGQSAQALRQLAADARPTAICAWGKDNRIEASSKSSLFGFDFLALQALIHPGNNSTARVVNE